jgi:hypothetical protein
VTTHALPVCVGVLYDIVEFKRIGPLKTDQSFKPFDSQTSFKPFKLNQSMHNKRQVCKCRSTWQYHPTLDILSRITFVAAGAGALPSLLAALPRPGIKQRSFRLAKRVINSIE